MNRAPILVLAALPVELAALARRLGLRSAGPVVRGTFAGVPLVAAASGVGLERARRRAGELVAAERPEAVLVTGIAGGLRPGLAVGEVLVPAEVAAESGERYATTLAASIGGVVVAGRLVSTHTAATTRAAKAALRRRYEADAVDMESAAVAAVCVERGVRWLCIRAISDSAEGELPAEALALTDVDGRPRLGAAARYVLRHPAGISPLLRLGRDARGAATAAAEKVAAVVALLAG
jgi:adenosylhomocysteine nucleosidase